MRSEKDVKEFLETHGFAVTKIEETDEKTPDFEAIGLEGERYYIELKCKDANPELVEQREEAFDAGNHFLEEADLAPRNRLSGVVGEAVAQLERVPDGEYKIGWFACVGHDASGQAEQFEATIFGKATIWKNDGVYPCHYFHNSEFFRHRNNLDAVFISTPKGLRLCLNNHSPNYERLRHASVCEVFGAGVVDPLADVEAGKALIVDAPVDRKDSDAVLEYLKEKYDDDGLTEFAMQEVSVTTVVPH